MRSLVIGISLAIVGLIGCKASYPGKYVPLADHSMKRTVKITVHATLDNGRQVSVGGAGALISSKGHVLTVSHLFRLPYSSFTVVLQDNETEYPGRLLITNIESDLALVRIDATTYNYFRLARFGQVFIGEEVLAIGHPLGFDWTVTHGIISQKRKNQLAYTQFLQTDASINPGNSGGPLININGQLIGINSHIYTPSLFPASAGIGMASSIDAIHVFLADLLTLKEVL